MKLEYIQINNTVRSGLNPFTDGVIIRDTKVLITLNLPDGWKPTIEGNGGICRTPTHCQIVLKCFSMRFMSGIRDTVQIFPPVGPDNF